MLKLKEIKDLSPQFFTKDKAYTILGRLAGTNCIITVNDKGERCAVCEWRFS